MDVDGDATVGVVIETIAGIEVEIGIGIEVELNVNAESVVGRVPSDGVSASGVVLQLKNPSEYKIMARTKIFEMLTQLRIRKRLSWLEDPAV